MLGRLNPTLPYNAQVEMAALEYRASRLVRTLDPLTGRRGGFGEGSEVVSARCAARARVARQTRAAGPGLPGEAPCAVREAAALRAGLPVVLGSWEACP
jgi:hypothetical protein